MGLLGGVEMRVTKYLYIQRGYVGPRALLAVKNGYMAHGPGGGAGGR